MDGADFLMVVVSLGATLFAVWLAVMAVEGGAPAEADFEPARADRRHVRRG